MKNPFVQSFGIFVALIVLGFGGVWAYQNLRTTEYTDPDTGVSIRFSTHLAVERATAQRDIQDKILFRIRQRGQAQIREYAKLSQTPIEPDPKTDPMLVTVRYEDDLRKVSNTLRKDLLDILVENSEKVFQREFIKYERVSERRFEHNGRRAAEVVFTYLSPYGKFVQQRFMILIRDENTAFYLSAQAPKEQFKVLNKRYFDTLFNGFDFKK